MKKVLILEDQKDTRDALTKIVKEVDDRAIVYALSSVEDAYYIALEKTIDLFLVDIILHPERKDGDKSGADFAQNIRTVSKYQFTPIIFLTSLYDSKLYMYSSLHCYKFIEKPFDYKEVRAVISEAIRYHTEDGKDRRIFFRRKGLLEAIAVQDIIYAQSVGYELLVVTTEERKEIPYKTCKTMLEELDSEDFLQCNRRTIVNRNFIKSVDTVNRYIYLNGCEDILAIGPVLKKSFLNRLQERGMNQ